MTEFESIYENNFSIVYKYMLSICRNPSLAEEVTQEAFVKALEHMKEFDGRCKLYVWICQIARNTYISYLRKQKRLAGEELIPVKIENSPEERFLDKEMAKQIYVLLNQLPEQQREVFSLRVFGELPFSQIGELFGKTDSWARLVYYRAKKKIKEGFDEQTIM